MAYIIDGHNLIPKLGLRLDDPNDEEALIERVLEFCRIQRTQAEIYFDGAPPGTNPTRKNGAVTCYFIRQGSSADSAIERQLMRLGKQARNWTIVSSDRRVLNAARSFHAHTLSSDEFAKLLSKATGQQKGSRAESGLSPEEVEDWLTIFKSKKK